MFEIRSSRIEKSLLSVPNKTAVPNVNLEKSTYIMAANASDIAILLLEGGCSRLSLPSSTAKELYTFLQMCRKNETVRQRISPSSKLDALWHWMLLNTDVSTCVHGALGGPVSHSTSTESDSLESKNKRRRFAMKLMTAMDYSPNPELWEDDFCNDNEERFHDDDSCYESDLSHGRRYNRRGSSILSHLSFWKGKEEEEETFQVTVRTLTGKSIILKGLTASTTWETLKFLLQEKEGIPPDMQRLIYQATQFSDDLTLGKCNVVPDATIDLVLRLSGC